MQRECMCLHRCILRAQVSTLMQKFAEVRSERSAPVQVLRKVLDIVVADCQAKFAW